ncbi:MAG: hypothetical protein ABS890_01430, partial [Carnobacterium inhibens]
ILCPRGRAGSIPAAGILKKSTYIKRWFLFLSKNKVSLQGFIHYSKTICYDKGVKKSFTIHSL